MHTQVLETAQAREQNCKCSSQPGNLPHYNKLISNC